MATVTCTPGGANDNSYVTEAQAAAFFAADVREQRWATFGPALQQVALLQATRELEALGGAQLLATSPQRALFDSVPYSTDQALHFPRWEDVDDDNNLVIPEPLQQAVLEQAFWLADREQNGTLMDFRALSEEGVQVITMDATFANLTPGLRPSNIAPRAWQYLIGAGLLKAGGCRTRVGSGGRKTIAVRT